MDVTELWSLVNLPSNYLSILLFRVCKNCPLYPTQGSHYSIVDSGVVNALTFGFSTHY